MGVSDYIWRYAYKINASILFRGIRTWEKDGKNEQFLLLLNFLGPVILGPFKRPIPTVFLQGKPELNHVSSTLIRNICNESAAEKQTNSLEGLVPCQVADQIIKLYSGS